MSYEEDYRIPYVSKCSCGKGFVRYYEVHTSNDWNQIHEYNLQPEIICEYCKSNFYCKDGFLVPNGIEYPQEPIFDGVRYNEKEETVRKYSKNTISDMINDMTAPKHRYIKDLSLEESKRFAEDWVRVYRKKSIIPMIQYLNSVFLEYEGIKESFDLKKKYYDKYEKQQNLYYSKIREIVGNSFRLNFVRDYGVDKETEKERKKYEEAHMYDDFVAKVRYDKCFKKDYIGLFWDTFLIKKCIDSQHFTMTKPKYGDAEITISKKYLCECQLCGREIEVLSSEFKIIDDSDNGYAPEPCCSCHCVSSFEAKAMELLNSLGVNYVREKCFDGLVGDMGVFLRFDFGLFKRRDKENKPIIDLLIELQGPHHYKQGEYGEYGEFDTSEGGSNTKSAERFLRQQRYDERKREFCKNEGIALEYIKYTHSNYVELEKTLIKILQEYGYEYER